MQLVQKSQNAVRVRIHGPDKSGKVISRSVSVSQSTVEEVQAVIQKAINTEALRQARADVADH